VLSLFSLVLAKRLAGKNVLEMTHDLFCGEWDVKP